MVQPIEIEIASILTEEQMSALHYCGKEYYKWEDIALPALVRAGYFITSNFYNLDGDSCGPLVRGINAKKDGVDYVIWYG